MAINVNDISKAHIQRPIRPLYAHTQATPVAGFLDPDTAIPAVFPGMVMIRGEGELQTLINDAANIPLGLSALYIGGDGVDEVNGTGVNACTTWVFGGPDAEFEIHSGAFVTAATWENPAEGTETLVHAVVDGANQGKLIPAGTVGQGTLSTAPVCRLLRVPSPTVIVVGGLR